MIAAPRYELRPLPYLISFGVVGAATAGALFGVGFLLLAPPRPALPPVDAVLAAQVLEEHEMPAAATNDTTSGPSAEPAVETTPSIPMPGAPYDREGWALVTAGIDSAPLPPAKVTHAQRVRVHRYHRQVTSRRWAASWRPNASTGPNSGGGFYGPPNINVGYINPK
jgi:hypothetical protein